MKRATVDRPCRRTGQRGVASLVVVMVLFFVVSLVAAYASRNLIFEQRTSANQYRSTQALEAAEAGLEWALALLNSGRVTDACAPSTNVADTSFRERYLNIDAANGSVAVRKGATSNEFLFPTCVLDGTVWTCTCPSDGTASPAVPTSDGLHPAFRVAWRAESGKPGVVRLFANGCTRLDDACLRFSPQMVSAGGSATGNPSLAVGAGSEANASISMLIALTGGAANAPVAALTAGGDVDAGGAAIRIFNGDAASGGVTIQAGGFVTGIGAATFGTTPGSPGDGIVQGDTALLGLGADRMFAAAFNMWRETFRYQPGTVEIACGGSPCTAVMVRDAVALNPGRPIWVQGNLTIDSAGDIGSATAPVLLTVSGDLDFGSSAVDIHGLVYVQDADWGAAGSARVRGAVVAEGDISGAPAPEIVYDPAVLTRLRTLTGSFVRVPGSWKDFW